MSEVCIVFNSVGSLFFVAVLSWRLMLFHCVIDKQNILGCGELLGGYFSFVFSYAISLDNGFFCPHCRLALLIFLFVFLFLVRCFLLYSSSVLGVLYAFNKTKFTLKKKK
jgi:hypothetical protein